MTRMKRWAFCGLTALVMATALSSLAAAAERHAPEKTHAPMPALTRWAV